jgi:phosphatidylglycerophosphate synthase
MATGGHLIMESATYRPAESDRRPLASRQWRLSIALACWLARRALGSVSWLGFVAAILAIIVAYVRAAIRVAGGPQDYIGPMAKQHRMFVVTLTALAGATVPAVWQASLTASGWGLPTVALAIICVGCVITAIRRLRGGARALMARTP